MAWTRIEITEASLLGGTYHRFCRRFQQAFIAAGAPDDMALFAQTFSSGETRTLYLTPASRAHLGELSVQGQPCAPPPAGEVTLVFGVPEAKQRLLAPLALGPNEASAPPAPSSDWRYAATP